MTTKELLRRLDFYSSLELASQFFDDDAIDFVYRTLYSFNGLKFDRYVPCTSYFFTLFSVDLQNFDYLYFDKFKRTDFMVQVRYFLSFYNRCSVRQREVLRSSGKLFSLLNYVSREQKS